MDLLGDVETRHRALLDAIPDLMLRLSRDGVYVEFAGDVRKLAHPPEDVLGSSVYDLLPPEASGPLMGAAIEAIETGELASASYPLTSADGVPRIWEARVVPSGPDEALAVIRDVTEYRQVLEELRASRARVVSAADAERRRVERNLHDGAQQRLVTVSLHLHLIAQRLRSRPETVPALLEAAQAELALGLEEIRELVRGLHPRILVEQGLGSALRALAERSLLDVSITGPPAERLGPATDAAAYYVVAEALANAAKHAQATHVDVRVALECEVVVVEVADDGVGGADPKGSGLQGLADRVAALGGNFAISSVRGAGTALRAELPAGEPVGRDGSNR